MQDHTRGGYGGIFHSVAMKNQNFTSMMLLLLMEHRGCKEVEGLQGAQREYEVVKDTHGVEGRTRAIFKKVAGEINIVIQAN